MHLSMFVACLLGWSLAGSVIADDAASGLFGSYFNTIDLTGPSTPRVDPQLNFTWSESDEPIAGIAPTTWSAQWTGYVQAPESGAFTIATLSTGGVEVWIDRKLVLRNWTTHKLTRDVGTIAMTAGRSYEIIVRNFHQAGAGTTQLLWSYTGHAESTIPADRLTAVDLPMGELPAGSGSGFTVSYFNTDTFMGPSIPDTAAAIDYQWGLNHPIAGITSYRWSAIWRGTLDVPLTDTYTLTTQSAGSLLVYVDGTVVIDRSYRSANSIASATLPLIGGTRHTIEVRYALPGWFDRSRLPRLALYWSSPAFLPTVLPGSRIFPPTADSTAFSIDSVATRISPAWVAGRVNRSVPVVGATINGAAAPVSRHGANGWYLDAAGPGQAIGMPLHDGITNTVQIIAGNDSETKTVTWEATDLADTYGIDPTVLRVGDSLLLTHSGNGQVVEIDTNYVATNGFMPTVVGTRGQRMPVAFATAGNVLVQGRIDGRLSGSLRVQVVGANLRGPIACEILYKRLKYVSCTHPKLVTFNADNPDELLCAVTSQANILGEVRLSLCPTSGAPASLEARLGVNGPIIVRQPIDAFMMRTTAERKIMVDEIYPDGSLRCSAKFIQTPGVPKLDVRSTCIKAGVFFADGTTTMQVNTSDFTPVPFTTKQETWFAYQLIAAAGTRDGICHTFVVYQDGVQISY